MNDEEDIGQDLERAIDILTIFAESAYKYPSPWSIYDPMEYVRYNNLVDRCEDFKLNHPRRRAEYRRMQEPEAKTRHSICSRAWRLAHADRKRMGDAEWRRRNPDKVLAQRAALEERRWLNRAIPLPGVSIAKSRNHRSLRKELPRRAPKVEQLELLQVK
jgi:hypothetical protein